MALTFSEALEQREQRRQERSVWNHIVDSLRRFVDDDTREATSGITADGCISKLVSQDVIYDIIQGIEEEKIIPLDEEIHSLENLQVAETKEDDEGEGEGGAGRKKKIKKKNTPRIRAVPSRSRGAGE